MAGKQWTIESMEDQSGRVAIVTGGNCGVGFEMVKVLALKNAHVIIASRSEEKGLASAKNIKQVKVDANVEFMELDLASSVSIRQFVLAFKAKNLPLHLLINNAGVYVTSPSKTEDGYEVTLGVNHFGTYLLTVLLLDTLKASAPARIVTQSSVSMKDALDLHLEDFDAFSKSDTTDYNSYAVSKLYNAMFALHLDKLLEGTGVRSFAVHPGSFIKTEIFNKMKLSLFKLFITWFVLPFKGMCVEDSGISGLYCATSPEVLGLDSGYFFGPDEKNNGFTDKRQVGTWNDGVTDKNSQILWNKTKELVGD